MLLLWNKASVELVKLLSHAPQGPKPPFPALTSLPLAVVAAPVAARVAAAPVPPVRAPVTAACSR